MSQSAPVTEEDLDELAGLICVPIPTFGQVFVRAQAARDTIVDLAEAAVRAGDDFGRFRACFAHARDNGYLGQLLSAGYEENIAGPVGSRGSQQFAELARRLSKIRIRALQDGIEGNVARFRAEARNPAGFDTDPMRLLKQINMTMRAVCRITDTENDRTGTGVLVAPHLVATAAHVVRGQLDDGNNAVLGSASKILIEFDVVAGLPGAHECKVSLPENWRVEVSRWPAQMVPEAGQVGALPEPDALDGYDDLVLIRLEQAPGFLRGWLDLADPGGKFDPERRGLLVHHHPGGNDQKVSIGAYRGDYGPRFYHDCSTLGGSSGGPVIDSRSRLVGVHHGTVNNQLQLGGGGKRLLDWRSTVKKTEFEPPVELNPIWEIRKTGKVGTGTPVLGFQGLQKRIWEIEHSPECGAMTVTGALNGGKMLFDLIEAMLPADRAVTVRFDRVILNDIVRTLGEVSTTESQTAAAIAELARRIGLTVPGLSERSSADPVEGRAAAPLLSRALDLLPADRAIWILVNISDQPVPTPLSEALVYLYRACIGLARGRGKLVVTGADTEIGQKVSLILSDSFSGNIVSERFVEPEVEDLAQYLQHWGSAVGDEMFGSDPVAARRFGRMARDRARLRASGAALYGALEAELADMKT